MIGLTISHYKILEKLGGGGMGVVYKAEDTKLDRMVALKFLPPMLTGDPEAKKRFIQEAKAASALQHHNVATIHEIDETDDGQMFICMDFYAGEALNKKIGKSPVEIEEAINIAIQIARGLDKAHKKGIVHRDIKPGNIMLTEDGVVKIVDFGLAKLAGQTKLTKEGSTLGTAAYMSPEQARGDEVDHRTDIWSLGVVLYEMITGQLPFKGDYEQAVIYSILNEEPEPMYKIRSDVPKNLEQIVNKALIKKPDTRYKEITIMMEGLSRLKEEMESDTSKGRKSAGTRSSIAVLPFVNMSADPEQEYFCDGMAEEIINALTHVESLLVIARTSAFSFKGKNINISEIGKELNVEYVLEGSVRKAGNRLRITAQLIQVDGGHHLWSERYDRELDDVFAIQDNISLAIVDNLKVKLLQKEKASMLKRHTEDQEAYNLYLKGRYHYQMLVSEGFEKAVGFFQQASEKDPDFSLPYFGLGMVHMMRAWWGNVAPHDVYPKSKEYMEKALKIDPDLGEALGLAGYISAFYDWNQKAAERDFKKGLQLNPSSADIHWMYAEFLSINNRHEEAISVVQHAQELDPLSAFVNTQVGLLYYFAGQPEEAIEPFETTNMLAPHFFLPYFILTMIYLQKSQFEDALAASEKAFELSGGLPLVQLYLILSCFRTGQETRAKTLLKELKERMDHAYVPPTCFLILHLINGQLDDALTWLKRACDARDSFLLWICIGPNSFIQKTGDPRFAETLKKYGIEL
jgi:serine/threonine protein kinase